MEALSICCEFGNILLINLYNEHIVIKLFNLLNQA